ncbi:MAG: hypothetical protein II202_03255 [Bacteroidales bacterium]|nr:hypothetical protein [Bacteroidales bacterium]
MFTLDSDLLGLLMALLTFFIPVITSIMEKRKKKGKGELRIEEFLPDEESQQSLDITEILGFQEDKSFPDVFPVEKAECTTVEEEVIDKLPDAAPFVEGASVTEIGQEPESTVAEEKEQQEKGVKQRLKDNPKDMVLFAEILKPKFKEY